MKAEASLLFPFLRDSLPFIGKVSAVPTLFSELKSLNQGWEPKRLNQGLGGKF